MPVEDFEQHRRQRGSVPPLPLMDVGGYVGVAAPKRQFIDNAHLMPMRQVVLLSGDGGTGKSLLALQLALACSTALTNWIGIEVVSGPVLYLSAEDDSDEIHNRIAEIMAAEEGDLERARGSLYFLHMAGLDATLAIEQRSNGTVKETELMRRLDATMEELRPVLVILDNLADIYGGNENNRSAVKHFIGMLRRLAIKHDCVILLLSHPSVSGLQSGSGISGSTAWSNSVRARMYLNRVFNGDGKGEEDEQARVLTTMKANYGPKGGEIHLRWQEGRLMRASQAKLFDGWTSEMLATLQLRLGANPHRCDPRTATWAGWIVAELMDLDAGRDRVKADCTAAQLTVRRRIGDMLAVLEKNGAIRRVSLKDPKQRKDFEYYRAGSVS